MDFRILHSTPVPSNTTRSRTPKRPAVLRASHSAQTLRASLPSEPAVPILPSQRQAALLHMSQTRNLPSQRHSQPRQYQDVITLVDENDGAYLDEDEHDSLFDPDPENYMYEDYDVTQDDWNEAAAALRDDPFLHPRPSTRRHTPPQVTSASSRADTIDLTMDSSPANPPPQPRKRPASTHSSNVSIPSESSKRQRRNVDSSSNRRENPSVPTHIDQIDLCEDDNSELASTLQKQRADAVLAQQDPKSQATKLSGLTCTVCLDNIQQLVVTTCGHAFCRKCLLDWLKAGANEHPRRSNCPACRKTLNKNRKTDIINVEIMKRPRQATAAAAAAAAAATGPPPPC